MRDADLDVAAKVERALLMLDDSKVHRGGREIRFRCLVHEDRHPSADYDRESGVWLCRSCGAKGAVAWGDVPLAPLLGIDVETVAPMDADELRRQHERIAQVKAESDVRARDALASYWRERRLGDELSRHADVLAMLKRDGIGEEAATHFRLGYTEYYSQGPALSIPWMVRGELRALQYRLLEKNTGDRYRWHEGSRATLFNADVVLDPHDDYVLVVEGAKKAMCLWSYGITSTCAVVNKHGWQPTFAAPFSAFARVVFVPDPDARGAAILWAKQVPGARVAYLPGKPDDVLVASGGDVDMLWSYIDDARRVA